MNMHGMSATGSSISFPDLTGKTIEKSIEKGPACVRTLSCRG